MMTAPEPRRGRDCHPARGTPWLFWCPEGHASVELFVTTFHCRRCDRSYPKSELVRVLEEQGPPSPSASVREALGVHVTDGGDPDAAEIEGPIPEVDEYGRYTGEDYYRCPGCGVEALSRELVRQDCRCEA